MIAKTHPRLKTVMRSYLLALMIMFPALNSACVFSNEQYAPYVMERVKQAQKLFDQHHPKDASHILQALGPKSDLPPLGLNILADIEIDDYAVEMRNSSAANANALLQCALKKEPSNSYSLTLLAYLDNLQGDYQHAVECSTKALTAAQPDPRALRQRALAYSHLKRIPEAVADLQQFMKKGNTRRTDFMLLGDLQRVQHKFADAAQTYALALRNGTSFQQRIFTDMIHSLEQSNQTDKALSALTEKIKSQPDVAAWYQLRASAYGSTGKTALAISDLSKAIELDDSPIYYAERAKLYDSLHRTNEAEMDRKHAAKGKEGNLLF